MLVVRFPVTIRHSKQCGDAGSWKELAFNLYNGDPFCFKMKFLPYMQPYDFRPEDDRDWGDAPPTFN